jgi:hypothetical protein
MLSSATMSHLHREETRFEVLLASLDTQSQSLFSAKQRSDTINEEIASTGENP